MPTSLLDGDITFSSLETSPMQMLLLASLVSLSAGSGGDGGPSGPQSMEPEVEQLLQEGEKDIAVGDFADALDLFAAAHARRPTDAKLMLRIGRAYLVQAQRDLDAQVTDIFIDDALNGGEATLAQARQMDPQSPEIAATYGRALLLQVKEAEAAKELDLALKLGAHDPTFWLWRGEAHFALSSRASDGGLEQDAARELALAVESFEAGRAEVIVTTVPKLTGADLAGASDLGAALHEHCLDAISRSGSPVYSELCRKLGYCHWFRKQGSLALAAFLEGVKVAPAELGAHEDLLKFANQQPDALDEAIQLYEHMTSEEPLRFWFQGELETSRGNRSYHAGLYRDAALHYLGAIAAYEISAAIDPEYAAEAAKREARAHQYAGQALTRAKAYGEAERHLVTALKLDPENRDPIHELDELGAQLESAARTGEVTADAVREFAVRREEWNPKRSASSSAEK
jgi:tetratricopeptide (TPR) repeat protein